MRNALFALLFAIAALPTQARGAWIGNDDGGNIDVYAAHYKGISSTAEMVVIDGECDSACTMVLGIVPRERICVTKRTSLGFHAAWSFNKYGRPTRNVAATKEVFDAYPEPIKQWIRARGGLKDDLVYLKGPALARMYPICRE